MRRRSLIGVMLVALLTVGVSGCAADSTATSTPSTPAPPLSATADWGLTMTADQSLPATIMTDESLLSRHVDVVNSFISWALQPTTQTLELDALRGVSSPTRTVMITWEPSSTLDSQGTSADDSLLPAIAAGDRDAEITAFAKQLADFTGPVVLRFAHEMNGNWYPWAGQPSVFIDAWKHLRTVIKASAPNVLMAWSVNNDDKPAANTLESYWPGSSQVDLIGLDGYNCLAGWQSPSDIFDDAYARVAALDPDLPIWITETASCEADTVSAPDAVSKAEWITQLFTLDLPRVSAVVWFDRDNEFDWRFTSSTATTHALRSALAG